MDNKFKRHADYLRGVAGNTFLEVEGKLPSDPFESPSLAASEADHYITWSIGRQITAAALLAVARQLDGLATAIDGGLPHAKAQERLVWTALEHARALDVAASHPRDLLKLAVAKEMARAAEKLEFL